MPSMSNAPTAEWHSILPQVDLGVRYCIIIIIITTTILSFCPFVKLVEANINSRSQASSQSKGDENCNLRMMNCYGTLTTCCSVRGAQLHAPIHSEPLSRYVSNISSASCPLWLKVQFRQCFLRHHRSVSCRQHLNFLCPDLVSERVLVPSITIFRAQSCLSSPLLVRNSRYPH